MASHAQSIIVTATFLEPSITITDLFPANKQVKTTIKALSGKLVKHLNKKDGYDLELKGRADISYHGSYPVTVQENAETKLSELHTPRLELVFRPHSHTFPLNFIHTRHKFKDDIAFLKEKARNQLDEFEEMKKTLKELQIGLKKQENELAKHKTDMGTRIQRLERTVLPLHIQSLLDHSRLLVMQRMQSPTRYWETFCRDREEQQLVVDITQMSALSASAAQVLVSGDSGCGLGNVTVDICTEDRARRAVLEGAAEPYQQDLEEIFTSVCGRAP